MIDITGVDLVEFAKKVYELSIPVGRGIEHYTPGPLADKEAALLVRSETNRAALDMDYVRGRCCKMVVWRKNGKLQIADKWHDHTDRIFVQLLSAFGIEFRDQVEHGIGCHCIDCQSTRAQL